MKTCTDFLGTLSLSELAYVYLEIPSVATREIFKWVKCDDAELIDERYIYVSKKHLDSISLLANETVLTHSNWMMLWLLRFFDPNRVAEEDFLDPELLRFKPAAKAVRSTIIMLQELITRVPELQRNYGNFQHLWLVYEVSKYIDIIVRQLVLGDKYKADKESIRQEYKRRIDNAEAVAQGLIPLPFQKITREEIIPLEKLVNNTYHGLFLRGVSINSHAARIAQECNHFDRHYYQPWLKIHRTLNNLGRKPGSSNLFISKDGELVNTTKSVQISKTRKRNSKKPKKGFG